MPRGSENDTPANAAIRPEVVLNAAYELLMAVGPSRVTVAGVARLAGVSRASIYRRWPNVEALVADVVNREWMTLASNVVPDPRSNLRDQLIDTVVLIAQATREHPMWDRILELDPNFLARYLMEGGGSSTEFQLQLMHFHLRRAMIEGTVREADPEPMAKAMLAVAATFVMSGRAVPDEANSLDAELKKMLTRYLEG